ncbi:MAG: hypothetical protein HY579_08570 [Nitrospinae bacterium]|nr:hypothetical protein [Nitrospinota bacterium]
MAFFEIAGRDAESAEAAIRDSLNARNLPLAEDEALFARFRQGHKSVCWLLRDLEKERARLQFELEERMKYIDSLHATFSWRVTKPFRALKKFFA